MLNAECALLCNDAHWSRALATSTEVHRSVEPVLPLKANFLQCEGPLGGATLAELLRFRSGHACLPWSLRLVTLLCFAIGQKSRDRLFGRIHWLRRS